jgi:ATP-dependent helicase/nuclease subunit B
MALPEGEFLPFAASWPAVRDGYVEWLLVHTAKGLRFVSAETEHTQRIGNTVLKGRIDRIDIDADGQAVVLDYKTESVSKSSARVKNPMEDTQIAFYAALLPDDRLRAGYVNVAEGDTKWLEQIQITQARDALLEGIALDMQRIADGAALPALGEGAACDYCQARGLCRKDFWTQP